MPFDPDQYLSQKGSAGGFNPDAYISQKSGSPQDPQTTYYQQECQQPWTTQAKHILLGDPADPMSKADPGLGAAALAIPAEAAPAALQKLAGYLGGSGVGPALSRIVVNSGLGYLQGGKAGAATGAALGVGGEAVSSLMHGVGVAAKYGGGTMANMTPEETNAYVRNPELAEEVYGQSKNNPSGFVGDLYAKLKEAASRLQEGYIDPRMAEISQRGVGKTYQVNPSDFEGTEAGQELGRQWKNADNRINVPLFEKTETPTFEANATETLSNLKTQSATVPTINPYYSERGGAIQVPTEEVSRSWDIKPGNPQTSLESVSPQSIPAPQPDTMSINQEPLLAAKRASSNAADLISGRNPNDVSVPDREQAMKESNAAVRLAKALHGQDPRTSQLDQEISEAIRYKNQALEQGNPAKILTNTDALGNLPSRAVQDYLDTNTGSNFRDLADAYSAGKAINAPNKIHGWVDRLAVVPAGRALVRTSPSLFSGAEGAKAAYPLIDQAVLRSLFSSGDSQ